MTLKRFIWTWLFSMNAVGHIRHVGATTGKAVINVPPNVVIKAPRRAQLRCTKNSNAALGNQHGIE